MSHEIYPNKIDKSKPNAKERSKQIRNRTMRVNRKKHEDLRQNEIFEQNNDDILSQNMVSFRNEQINNNEKLELFQMTCVFRHIYI